MKKSKKLESLKVLHNFLLLEFSCIPIFTEEESLKSIAITEIDLPTEAYSSVNEKDFPAETEKSETSFAELYVKYDELFIKNSSHTTSVDDETPLRKRNLSEEEVEDKNQSVIEKIEDIVGPEVRKEFALDLPNNRPSIEEENEKTTDTGTEYEPIYATKVITAILRQTDDEVLRENVENLGRNSIVELTTLAAEDFTVQPKIIEVVEQVFYQPDNEKSKDVMTHDPLSLHVDFDPIVVATTNELRNLPDEAEMVEGVTSEVEQKTESTVIAEKLKPRRVEEIVDEKIDDESITDRSIESTTVASRVDFPFETRTEITEVRTEISVNFHVDESSSTSEDSKHVESVSSNSEKSSEESNSSKEHKEKENVSSAESSEENTGKEIFDKDELRSLESSKASHNLLEELYKDTIHHEITKKDEAKGLTIPLEAERKLDSIAQATTLAIEETTLGLYETLEEIATTVSDGFKLSSELKSAVDSFRDYNDENKIVLDTNNEAVSSKNIKSNLVNIAEEMTLEKNIAQSHSSYIAVSLIGFASLTVVVGLFLVLKQQTTRFDLF